MTALLERFLAQVGGQHKEAVVDAQAAGLSPADYLISSGLCSASEVLLTLSDHYELPPVALEGYLPEQEALFLLNYESATRLGVLPLFTLEGALYAATADPDNLESLDFVAQMTGLTIFPVVATPADLELAIKRRYLTKEEAGRAMGELTNKKESNGRRASSAFEVFENKDAPAIKLVDQFLTQAIHLRASDIHLERNAERATLRYRIDGVLHEFPAPPLDRYAAVVSRIKLLSNLDVAERRHPQDGRTSITINRHQYDMRVSVIPMLHGEAIVLRVLSGEASGLSLEELGFEPSLLERYHSIISKPNGITVVTGPTGSGKSTTLYSTLRHICTEHKKLITLEDPVEFEMEGVSQIQVRSDIGFTFQEGLRAILRHDPDIVMVGEIRDLASAQIAIKASMTGHALFATLHTNNSLQVVLRLMDMGVEPFKVMASLNGALAQRLLRRLCDDCKAPYEAAPWERELLGLGPEQSSVVLHKSRGCVRCGKLGYAGRVAIYELFEVTPEIRQLGSSHLTPQRLTELAYQHGYVSLRDSAAKKVLQGTTSLDEFLKVAGKD